MPKASSSLPSFDLLMWPTVQAIKELGGSATNIEIFKKVMQIVNLSEDVQRQLHKGGPQTEIEYRLAWARTYLKKYGAVTNSERGVWNLTEEGQKVVAADIPKIVGQVRATSTVPEKPENTVAAVVGREQSLPDDDWKGDLLRLIQYTLTPAAFERLAQRLLRESGFEDVEVIGRSGDGGIDGLGLLRIGLLSFKVGFQCKRYKGSVGSPEVRNFRGAVQGRVEKGVFITTGSFTSDAKEEARRDGAIPIDTLDGDQLCEMLKRLKLGIKTVETVTVDAAWFEGI